MKNLTFKKAIPREKPLFFCKILRGPKIPQTFDYQHDSQAFFRKNAIYTEGSSFSPQKITLAETQFDKGYFFIKTKMN
jgi:hypothetical protein